MASAEDVRTAGTAATSDDADTKRTLREAFADGPLKRWAANVQAQIEGPFLGGDTLSVADLKVFVLMRWFVSGGVDHVSKDVFADFPKLTHQAVSTHPGAAVGWYAR